MSQDTGRPANPQGEGASTAPLFIERLAGLVVASTGLAAAVIAASVCYGVFMRSVLGYSVIWVEEVSAYLIGYIVFVGMGAALYQGAHVEVDFLLVSLKGRAASRLRLFCDLAVLLLAGVLVALSWGYWHDAFTSGERSVSMLSVPLWIPYLTFLAGSVLLFAFQAARLLGRLCSMRPRAQAAHREVPS